MQRKFHSIDIFDFINNNLEWLERSSRPTEISAETETGPGTAGAVAGWTEAEPGLGWDPRVEGSGKAAVAAGKTGDSEQSSAAAEAAGKTAAAVAAGRTAAGVVEEQTVEVVEVVGEQTEVVVVEGEDEQGEDQSDRPDHHHGRNPPAQSVLWWAETREPEQAAGVSEERTAVAAGQTAAEERTVAVVGPEVSAGTGRRGWVVEAEEQIVWAAGTAGDSERTAGSAGTAEDSERTAGSAGTEPGTGLAAAAAAGSP